MRGDHTWMAESYCLAGVAGLGFYRERQGQAMPERICYFVRELTNGWDVRFDHANEPQTYGSKTAAIEAAREAAITRWRIFGRPSCVVIETADGGTVEDVSYGS